MKSIKFIYLLAFLILTTGNTSSALAADEANPPGSQKPKPPTRGTETIIRNSFSQVIAGSTPDNSYSVLSSVIDASRKSIRLSAYMLRSVFLSDKLEAAAKRGVKVTILLDGWTVGRSRAEKIDKQELHNAKRIIEAGGSVIYLASDRGPRDDRRYKYLHSKYLVLDDEVVYVSSENFANSGYPTTRSVGSRGWVIAIKNQSLAAMYTKIFEADIKPIAKFNDIAPYGSRPEYTLKDKNFVPERKIEKGTYIPVEPIRVSEKMTLERIMSPEDANIPTRALAGAIKSAERSLVIQNLSFAPHWGSETDTPRTNPSIVAEAVLAAARKGVSVRVMVNPNIFFRNPGKPSDPGTPPKDPKNGDEDEEEEGGEEEGKENPCKTDGGCDELMLGADLNFSFANFFQSPEKLGLFGSKPQDGYKSSTRDNEALLEYFRSVAKKENLDIQANFFWVENDGIRLLHNKGMVVDEEKTLISSINWVENSIKNNREAAVLVTSKAVARYYQDLFDRDWKYNRNTKQ